VPGCFYDMLSLNLIHLPVYVLCDDQALTLSTALLSQAQLSQIKKNQEKLLIAHERSKTITRSAEMKEIRERMQVRKQKGACIEKKDKDYAFWHQFKESSITLGCPGACIRQQNYYCLLHSVGALVALRQCFASLWHINFQQDDLRIVYRMTLTR